MSRAAPWTRHLGRLHRLAEPLRSALGHRRECYSDRSGAGDSWDAPYRNGDYDSQQRQEMARIPDVSAVGPTARRSLDAILAGRFEAGA
jgi:hypothetical protein